MTIDYPPQDETKKNNDKYSDYFLFLSNFLDRNYSLVKSSSQIKVNIFSTKTLEQRIKLKNFLIQHGNIEKLRDIILSFHDYDVIYLKNAEKKSIENEVKLKNEIILYCHLLIALDVLLAYQVVLTYLENEKFKEILLGLLNLKNIESTKEISDLLNNESDRMFFEIELAEYLRNEELYKFVFSEEFIHVIDRHVDDILEKNPGLLNQLEHEDKKVLLREYIQESYILDHEIAHHEEVLEKAFKKFKNFHFNLKIPQMPALRFKDITKKIQEKEQKTHVLMQANNEDNKLFLEQYLKDKGEQPVVGANSLDDRKAYIEGLKQLNAQDKIKFLEEKLQDKKNKRARLLEHKIDVLQRKRSNISSDSPQIPSAYHVLKDEMHGRFDAEIGLVAVHDNMITCRKKTIRQEKIFRDF